MATVTVDVQHWLLTDHAAMAQCLHDLSEQGFRGHVRVFPEPTPPEPPPEFVPHQLWDLELNDNAHLERPSVTAGIGQVVVFFGGVLQVMTSAEFTGFGGQL